MNRIVIQSILTAATLFALTGVSCSNPPSAQSSGASPAPGASAHPAARGGAPTDDEVATAIRSYFAKLDPAERVRSVSSIRIARDSKGSWWAWGEFELGPGSDGGAVIMNRSSDGWKVISQGSSPDVDLIPVEIRKELRPAENR